MAIRQGRYTLNLTTRPSILGNAAVVGKTEGEDRFRRSLTTYIQMTRSGKSPLKRQKAPYSGKPSSVHWTRRAKRLQISTMCSREIY